MRDAIPSSRSNGVASIGIMKMMGLRKSTKHARQDVTELSVHKKIRVSFHYIQAFMHIILSFVYNVDLIGFISCNGSSLLSFHLRCCSLMKNL